MTRLFYSVFIFGMLSIFHTMSWAGVSRWVDVSYERKDGMSEPRLYRVFFVTGQELNDREQSYRFNGVGVYAFVLFPNGGRVFLETELMSFENRLTRQGFCEMYSFTEESNATQLNGKYRKGWTLRAKRNYSTWIDPQAAKECP
jgi:hypothetical protein